MVFVLMAVAFSARAQTITNLLQLTEVMNLQPRVVQNVRLEVTVCSCVSRPEIGVLIKSAG